MRLVPNRKGILLLASVMLIIFVSIVVVGTTVFIAQRLRYVNALRVRTSCINLAQAGINYAIYQYRLRDLTGTGYFSTGQTNLNATDFFILNPTAADLLMVDTRTAVFGGGPNRDLLNLKIQNATNSQTITIDRMQVSWTKPPPPLRTLKRIRINGVVRWSGTAASGDIVPLTPNFPLVGAPVPPIYPINELRFSGNMLGAAPTTDVNIQFFMTDGSSKIVTVFPASLYYNFTVSSQGKTVGSNIARTVRAEYNTITGRVVNYLEP